MSETNENRIAPINYFKIFFRRKELFIFSIFGGLVLGICAGIILPKKYRSSTIILVQEGKTDNPLFNQLAVSTTVQQRMNTITESILGWNNLVQLVKRLNLDKDIKTAPELEKLILGIRKDIKIKMRSNNIIDLGYVGLEPVQTQAIVKNITDIFIERNVSIQNQETADAITFIEEQLKVYRGKIKSSEIAQLEDQLKALLVDSTEKHPLVKQLREQVRTKKEELQKENLQYTKSDQLETQTTNPIISEIKKALDNLESKQQTTPAAPAAAGPETDMYKVMLMDRLDEAVLRENVMARDVRVNDTIYNMLLQRLETAKITQRLQSSKEGTKYSVLDPPRAPFEPFYPNRPLLVFIGLFLGGVLGFALVFLAEFFDRSFIDVEETKDFLGVPLFGAISKIATELSLRQERERKQWLYGLTLVGGMIVVIVTVAVTNFLK